MSKSKKHQQTDRSVTPLSHFDVPTATGSSSSAGYTGPVGPNPANSRPPAAAVPPRPVVLAPLNRRPGAPTNADLQPGVIQSPGSGRPGNTDARSRKSSKDGG